MINLKNVNLFYPIFNQKSLRSTILNKEKNIKYYHALKNINLNFQEGECVAIVGHNGSGKSSLLKVLSDVYRPTNGLITFEKKITSLLDLNVGLNLLGNATDNAYILGNMIGLNKKYIQKNLNLILEFSGIPKRFHQLPLSTYSDGMRARILISIALTTRTEILVMDEFFGAVDKDFREKIFQYFKKKINEIKVFIIATHDEQIIKNFCNRVIELENGVVVEDRYISN